LLDFGLAKMSDQLIGAIKTDADATLTMALTTKGEIVGTLSYMSPEQIQGKETGPPSDIFSFGLVLYEMVTGKRALQESSPASVIAAILEREPPSISGVAPESLDRVLKRCLAKNPEDRWQSAHDLKLALEMANTRDTEVRSKQSVPLGAWAAILGLAAAPLWLVVDSASESCRPVPRMTAGLFFGLAFTSDPCTMGTTGT